MEPRSAGCTFVAMRELLLAPSHAWALHQDGRATLIDLRSSSAPDPDGPVRIPGARVIPLEDLARELVTIDPGRPVVFLSSTGRKARGAMRALRAAGMAAWAVEGGIRRWRRDGLPVEIDGATDCPARDEPHARRRSSPTRGSAGHAPSHTPSATDHRVPAALPAK